MQNLSRGSLNCIRSSQNAEFICSYLSTDRSIFIQCKSMPEKHQWTAYNCAHTNNSNRNLMACKKVEKCALAVAAAAAVDCLAFMFV